MKRVDTIARVRRAFYVQRWSVKKIVRELHVSRNTVRKILRSDETDFSYERTHQPMPRIGPWQEQLDRFLAANAEISIRLQSTPTRPTTCPAGRSVFMLRCGIKPLHMKPWGVANSDNLRASSKVSQSQDYTPKNSFYVPVPESGGTIPCAARSALTSASRSS